jgi:uncharacterized membrane protein YedE/YeeE
VAVSNVAAFVVGVTFALGLGIGGMSSPERVLAFLDVAGAWDPRLAFVMLGAVFVYATAFRLVMRRSRPLLAPAFVVPARRDIDRRLIGGALAFGVGWGIAGLCPGPALTALASGEPRVWVFVAAMVAGIAAHKAVERAIAARPASHAPSMAAATVTSDPGA